MLLQHLHCLVANMMWCHLRTRSANHFTLLSLRLSLSIVGYGGLGSSSEQLFSPFLSPSQQQFQQLHIKHTVNAVAVPFARCIITSYTHCQWSIVTQPPFHHWWHMAVKHQRQLLCLWTRNRRCALWMTTRCKCVDLLWLTEGQVERGHPNSETQSLFVAGEVDRDLRRQNISC